MAAEFLQLAHNYKDQGVAGWYMSEKLDGMRAFWDGGISRGVPATQVPYANTEKDARLVQTSIATGLWSRYAKVIHAPDWFLDQLPRYPVDGELYMGRGEFQRTLSTVKKHVPTDDWKQVQYLIFDMPAPVIVFADRKIKNPGLKLDMINCYSWFQSRGKTHHHTSFEQTYNFLLTQDYGSNVRVHLQSRLPFATQQAIDAIQKSLEAVSAAGGEGLMLRKPITLWIPERSHNILKVKKLADAEATVIGYKWGKETDKGSKLLGMMGSLRCRLDSGVEFDLSGFTDEERQMSIIGARIDTSQELAAAIGRLHPGEVVGSDEHNPMFPRGSRITFQYRELTVDGSPKEARYLRKYNR